MLFYRASGYVDHKLNTNLDEEVADFCKCNLEFIIQQLSH